MEAEFLAAGLDQRDCPVCGDMQLIETPPCADGHGEQCPDRACVGCGSAVFVNPSLIDNRWAAAPSTRGSGLGHASGLHAA